jgi:hypothetical protein
MLKNAVFWDVTPCGSCKKRCFEGMFHLDQGDRNQQANPWVSISSQRASVASSVTLFAGYGGGTFLKSVGS